MRNQTVAFSKGVLSRGRSEDRYFWRFLRASRDAANSCHSSLAAGAGLAACDSAGAGFAARDSLGAGLAARDSAGRASVTLPERFAARDSLGAGFATRDSAGAGFATGNSAGAGLAVNCVTAGGISTANLFTAASQSPEWRLEVHLPFASSAPRSTQKFLNGFVGRVGSRGRWLSFLRGLLLERRVIPRRVSSAARGAARSL